MNHVTTFSSRLLIGFVIAFLAIAMSTSAFGQLLFNENFNYTAGTLLTANGYTAHSGAGTNSHFVTSAGLSYAGYASSGIGLADTLRSTGEDVNKTFLSFPSGNLLIPSSQLEQYCPDV